MGHVCALAAPHPKALLGQVNALRGEVAEVERFQGLLEEASFAVELLEAEQVRLLSCWKPSGCSCNMHGGGPE